MRKRGELLLGLKVSDYTSLRHRFKKLEFEIPESEDKVVAAVGATGIKMEPRRMDPEIPHERTKRMDQSPRCSRCGKQKSVIFGSYR
ncbi:hypothetical protein AKJ62_02650 [candidate division MSBL1 archaeon SCGC-AAA259D14]|uniref:Uncharacterized protein n=1 Tax=candidate division MSBL1 archaeon SCGC-AAA259D14 TaxID=1698261 RepID=A0A133U626_9EURY|nr:hypothetical protein AKJ62_02650 [candidate division MSBL1 archaeon SCGC-AAA259D14]